MGNLKIIAFDRSHGFSRVLKHHFSEKYEFQIWKGNKNDFIDYEKIHVAFIYINDYESLLEAMIISHYSKLIFWSTSIEEVKESLSKMDDFIYVDMEMNKKGLINLFSDRIKLFKNL